ncbi:hypothetical protein HpCHN43_00830 [Helicobacter pylori]
MTKKKKTILCYNALNTFNHSNLISKDIHEKNPFTLSLSLASSLLNAEDNGFFISAGYQIGEAAQMVKNTGELKRLSDTYENLSNLLSNFNNLNQAVTNASSPSAINAAIDNLKANTQGLIGEKTNSPAYQAVSLALNATVGLWNVIGYAIMCGNGNAQGVALAAWSLITNQGRVPRALLATGMKRLGMVVRCLSKNLKNSIKPIKLSNKL